ncbi:DUF4113 domain-containing protein [Chromobacterium violaceum]|uniref:DNA polymerase V subunit UmuC n=1 Tax=Chromobacterium violaceum TaxID=536 RepID=A0AAX2M707_CHRVL|nr:DUF4113 domain-containing protein [Chromobacterium violaceum]OLZ74977.1 hypothetical protein BS642_19875 [Chromobacterium violaceum]STB63974.1 DNA polymerase V subunit UmuC [Chromobacterium violaceum]SUX32257.1 DNA polymerase V subunit UmuC [Chromobacterium violaceum]
MWTVPGAVQIGIPVSVGIGPSKTLAKLANHVAKRVTGWDDGVFDWSWLSPAETDALMARLPAGKVWGVGPRLAARLAEKRIDTALKLKRADPRWLQRNFSVTLERTAAELNGVSCLSLEEAAQPRQQIISSRSFGEKTSDLAVLSAAVRHHIARAAEKLREQGSAARLVGVSARTSPFGDDPYHGYTVVPLAQPSDDTLALAAAALAGLRAAAPDPRRQRLMRTLDAINRAYGHSCVKLASEALTPNWEMRQDQRSPCYTTRFDQLPTARA